MNAKKSLENRIRGWFPKEALRFSFQADVYSEWVSVGKFVKALVGLISALGLAVLVIAIWFGISIRSPPFIVVIALPLIFILTLFLNYRGVHIRITSKELIVSYGIFNRKRIPISDIASCERTKANFGKYFGVGIRYGTDGSWAYSTSFSNAVKINRSKGRPFVFSSNNPDDICSTISRIKQKYPVRIDGTEGLEN
jgi:membrane protein YdbS with pleckstrin-like domain